MFFIVDSPESLIQEDSSRLREVVGNGTEVTEFLVG